MSNLNNALLEAYRRGYRVSEEGDLLKPSGKPASFTTSSTGYKISRNLTVPGCSYKTWFFVHRLAAYQWFGDIIFRPSIQVRHLNNDSADNSRKNLAIGSQSENILDIPEAKRKSVGAYAASYLRSLSPADAQRLIDDRKDGMTYRELIEKYGVAKSTVSYIVNGKTYPELVR